MREVIIKKSEKLPKVSIIIPTFNGWSDTNMCLKSLKKLTYPKNSLEVIVTDNNSTDLTCANIKKYFPAVKLIRFNKNLGYAKAVNIGFNQTQGKYVLFSNNDIVLSKKYLMSMINLAKSDPKIGIIGGMVYLKKPRGKIGFNGLMVNAYLGYHQHDLQNLKQVRECDIPPPGGFFVKRSMLNKIGFLDERFFLYYEDLDLCLRAKYHGFKVMFNPEAIAYHGHSRTTFRQNFEKIVFQMYKSKWRCIFKNASLLQIITSIIFEFTFLQIYHNIKSNPKPFKEMFKGFFFNVKNLNNILKTRRRIYSKTPAFKLTKDIGSIY